MCLHDYLKRLSSKVCFDASFTSLSRFVSFRVSFNYKCCWTQRCGLFSRIRLWLTDQSWYTGPNESALLFELVFIVWWHQIRKLVRLFSKQFYDFFLNALQIVISSYYEDIETNLPIGKHTLRVFTWYFEEIAGKTLFGCFISVFVFICCVLCHINQLWCCLLSCIDFWVTDQSWLTGPNDSVSHFKAVFVICWH